MHKLGLLSAHGPPIQLPTAPFINCSHPDSFCGGFGAIAGLVVVPPKLLLNRGGTGSLQIRTMITEASGIYK